MNERIKELYNDASEQFKIVQDQGLPAPYQTRVFAEKFAELIVKECARIARATPTPNEFRHSGDWLQALSHTWDMACAESGSEIVKHF
mgnify:CR=1 FL=1